MLPGAEWLVDAFYVLSADRPVGFGVAPIPFTPIDRYAQRYGLSDPDHFEPFMRAIQIMDGVWMDAMRSKEPA